MKISKPGRTLVASVTLAASLIATLAGCSPSDVSGATPTASRDASAYRASRICVVNDSGVTLENVAEYEMTRTDVSHPDPAGPLAPGATWCTNGYDSFTDANGEAVDATVQINFTTDPTDFVQFEVDNPYSAHPWMQNGYNEWYANRRFTPGLGGSPWEIDHLVPTNTNSGPHHPVHLRRADDSDNFIEWIVTVRP